MATLRLALIQLRVDDGEEAEARIARAESLIRGCRGVADLVVLPELWQWGAFCAERNVSESQPLDGPLVQRMGLAAQAAGVRLHMGTFPECAGAPGSRPFNTSAVLSATGELEASYRKMHLFGFDQGEARLFEHGPGPVVWSSPWGGVGLATCYDLRFPELFRALVDLGAAAFIVPAGWPEARIARWTLLAQARAVENLAFMVAVNCVGTNGGVQMGGRSIVVDPTGEVVAQASATTEEVVVVVLRMEDAVHWRDRFPALRDRRL